MNSWFSRPQGSLIESEDREFLDLMAYGYHNRFRRVKDVLEENAVILKIAVYHKGSIRRAGRGKADARWKTGAGLRGGRGVVDFMDKSVDKGNALRWIQQRFGIRARRP